MTSNMAGLSSSSITPGRPTAARPQFMTIEAFAANKDPYRVVAHGLPRPSPWRSGPCAPEIAARNDEDVELAVALILARYGIGYTSYELCHRWKPDERGIHTYIICTVNEDTRNWKEAAVAIQNMLFMSGLRQDEVEVEIINPTLSAQKRSRALGDDPELLRAMRLVLERVFDFASAWFSDDWTGVTILLCGPGDCSDAVERPTALIFCRAGLVADFAALERMLQELVYQVSPDVMVEIVPGRAKLY